MRIVHISTFDAKGGAARAAFRLHKGILDTHEESCFGVMEKDLASETIVRLSANESGFSQDQFFQTFGIQGQYIDSNRTAVSNTLFSFPYPGMDVSEHALIRSADIINLHWVSFFQSPRTLNRLLSLGKPVVWTLHDQEPFTGGCHFSAGCRKFESDCADCPQLLDDPCHLPPAVLKDKEFLFQSKNLTIVTPSRWLGSCAKASRVFGDSRIEVIPNSIETDVFSPVSKAGAKAQLGIDPESSVVLYGAQDCAEKRKGFKELFESLRLCSENTLFRQMTQSGKLVLLNFGLHSKTLGDAGIPSLVLGYVDSDEAVRIAFSAADIYLLPSLEDNLANTLLESMSCGTPVIAFDAGGNSDVINSGIDGQLVPVGNTELFSSAIISLLSDPDKRNLMGLRCREKMEASFSLPVQAKRYMELYRDLSVDRTHLNELQRPALTDDFQGGTVFGKTDESLGPFTQAIYENLLLRSLKTVSFSFYQECRDLRNRLEASEADRAERLNIIQEQAETFKQRLEASEADRAERLRVIKSQAEFFEQQLEACESDREARLAIIQEQSAILNNPLVRFAVYLKGFMPRS